MSHRAFRLSISPDDHPEVSRVVDFDGRHSLHDVHEFMRDTLNIGDDDHLYAFFMSGKYWDQSSEYVDSRTEGPRADRALLFRLGLRAGNRFVYVYDYGEEQRYSLSVVSVTEIDAPLTSPVLVESAGEKPVAVEYDEDARPATDPAFQQSLGLATTVLEQSKALAESKTDTELETTRSLLRQLGETALQLLQALDGNLQLTSQIDEELEFELIECLLNLPERLYMAAETELAVRVAESLKYCAPDDMNGEIALAYANAGDRERALARVLTNLESPDEPFVAECKSGAVYRALGEADAAEAYYRRAFAIARTAAERRQATLRITSLLIDTGREVEAAAFIAQQKQAATSAPDANPEPKLPSVGRNDPCPCGSGKKYKKCHGT